MRAFMLIAFGGIFAWFAATAQDVVLALPMLRSVRGSPLPLLTDLLWANQEFVYLGAGMGVIGAVLVRRQASVLRQWVAWSLIGAVVYVFLIMAMHIKGTGKIIAWQDLIPRNWLRTTLLIPIGAVAILLPLLEALVDGIHALIWRWRTPRQQVHAGDTDFDALDNREQAERAESYLTAKRRARAGAARPNDTWAIEK